MELKTLNDFQTYDYEWEDREFIECIPKYKLKAEAKNHIKVIKEKSSLNSDLEFLHKVSSEEANAIISYIIWNNNLEENDLK